MVWEYLGRVRCLVCGLEGFVIRGRKHIIGGLHSPDLASILGDRPVTGELAAAGNVVNRLLGPFLGVLV